MQQRHSANIAKRWAYLSKIIGEEIGLFRSFLLRRKPQ